MESISEVVILTEKIAKLEAELSKYKKENKILNNSANFY